MSWLKKLEQDKINQEKYEKEQLTLKESILEINNLYSLYDGDFIDKLKKFINNYKTEHV